MTNDYVPVMWHSADVTHDDVISGMHSPLPRDAMAERAMVVGTV
jgi:hypothetical protein